jgi:hypothetical protein
MNSLLPVGPQIVVVGRIRTPVQSGIHQGVTHVHTISVSIVVVAFTLHDVNRTRSRPDAIHGALG